MLHGILQYDNIITLFFRCRRITENSPMLNCDFFFLLGLPEYYQRVYQSVNYAYFEWRIMRCQCFKNNEPNLFAIRIKINCVVSQKNYSFAAVRCFICTVMLCAYGSRIVLHFSLIVIYLLCRLPVLTFSMFNETKQVAQKAKEI